MSDQLDTTVNPYKLQEIKPLTFIFQIKGALTPDICEEIIQRFEANPDQQYIGRIGQMAKEDPAVKRTTDLSVSANEGWEDIDQILHRSLGLAIREFQHTYPFFRGPFKDIGYNIQRYSPGGYYNWHIDSGSHQFADRQLVAIWYLNTIEGPGGETEFFSQDVKIKPEAGKLVLFPPFWTHEHRAVKLEKETKYIATTWVVFA